MKKWIPTIFLTIILLGVGGYLLWTYTDFDEIVQDILTKRPSVSTVEEYFPSDEVIEIGTATTTLVEGKHYVFLIDRSGVRELLLLPKDFNRQDINARTYLTISSGEFVPELETDLLRMNIQNEILDVFGEESRMVFKHNIVRFEEGMSYPEVVIYYKAQLYNSGELWIYNDKDNYIKFDGDEEMMRLLETF